MLGQSGVYSHAISKQITGAWKGEIQSRENPKETWSGFLDFAETIYRVLNVCLRTLEESNRCRDLLFSRSPHFISLCKFANYELCKRIPRPPLGDPVEESK